MEQQEMKIARIEKEILEAALKEKYAEELDQELLNEQIKDGLVYVQDKVYEFREIRLIDVGFIRVPDYFQEMREEFIKRKYPSEQRPDKIYTNYSSKVNLTFSHTQDEVEEVQFERYLSNIYSSVRKMYGSEAVLSEGNADIGGNRIGYFDFITQAFDKKIYNYMFQFLAEGRVVRVSLNCPGEDMELWKPLAVGIMSSLQIR